jgi:hypothetical protein
MWVQFLYPQKLATRQTRHIFDFSFLNVCLKGVQCGLVQDTQNKLSRFRFETCTQQEENTHEEKDSPWQGAIRTIHPSSLSGTTLRLPHIFA